MGQTSSKSPANADDPFADCNRDISDGIKLKIKSIDSGKKYHPLVKEHTPSLKASELKDEIERAGEISKASYAPSPTCIDYSIFPPGISSDWGGNETILNFKGSNYEQINDLEACLGSLYGMLIGDSWGHCLEFVPVQYEKTIIRALDETNFKAPGVLNRFGLKAGQYTDDSSMGLCLADNLLTHGHVDCLDLRKRFVMWWYLGYNNAFRHDTGNRGNPTRTGRSVGLGGQISYSLKIFIDNPKQLYPSGDEDMSGNGSIMRLCPLPIFYRDSDTEYLVSEAMKQSFTTHSGVQSAECAALLSFIIVAAIKSDKQSGREFLDTLDMEPVMQYLITDTVKCIANSKQHEGWTEDKFNKVPEDQYWNWKDENYKYSPTRSAANPGYVGGYACDNISMALHCVYNSDSFELAVLRCINRCGDADTVGSVTGQIAGAVYGLSSIPKSALECVMKWDPEAEIPHRVIKTFPLP